MISAKELAEQEKWRRENPEAAAKDDEKRHLESLKQAEAKRLKRQKAADDAAALLEKERARQAKDNVKAAKAEADAKKAQGDGEPEGEAEG